MEEKKLENLEKRERGRLVRRIGWVVLWVAVAAGIIFFLTSLPRASTEDVISRNGLHWHPILTIYVDEEKQDIPPNIGIGALSHQPIHTHKDSDQGILHMEFDGLVRKKDTTLWQFFKNWGKDFHFFGKDLRMTVNGKENTEYENYEMHDGDKIELRYK